MQVNTAVQFQNHSPVDSGGGTSEDSNIDPAKEPKFQLYELAISNLCVTFDSSATGTAAEDEDSDSEEEDGSIDRLDSSSQDDADSPKNQFVGFAGNSNSNSASEKSGGEVFTSTNPLHGAKGRSLVSDVKVAKSRPASSKGVSFASEPPPSEGIEMSPSASATTSPLPSPRHSPPQSPSASPSPSPTPSPSQSPSRPAMLGRSRSANSAALNATTAPTALTVATTTESNSNSNMNTEDSTSSSTSSSFSPPQARPRFLSRLSLLPSSLSSSSKERESEPILSAEGGARRPRFLTMDRQKSDNMLSKSLVKNRNRSIFGAFMKTEKAPEPTPQDEEGDIIDELSRDSMSWEGGDHGGGNWRRRLEQEEAERKLANKKRSVKIVSKIKKKTKKLKKNDKKVHQVVIVFPLPAKDPLLAHRKLYDFSKAYNLGADAADDIER